MLTRSALPAAVGLDPDPVVVIPEPEEEAPSQEEEESLICESCNHPCSNQEELDCHNAYTHLFSTIFICSFCDKQFTEKLSIGEHILEEHLNKKGGGLLDNPSSAKLVKSSTSTTMDLDGGPPVPAGPTKVIVSSPSKSRTPMKVGSSNNSEHGIENA